MVASEWGIAGLIAYLGIYGSAFLNLSRVKRSAVDQTYFYWRALAVQLALVAFLVAGAFTDRLYAEAGYWMVGLSYALLRLQRTEQAETALSRQGHPSTDAEPEVQVRLPHSTLASAHVKE